MHVRNFESQLWLPRSRPEVFAFFSDPQNLDLITPAWLHFRTIMETPGEIRKDTIMYHRLRIHGFPLRWRSKIIEWDPPARFVDQQIHGPYRLWIHEHRFEEQDRGTLVHDRVRYAVPFDFLIHRKFIRPDIERIFAYRSETLLGILAGAHGT
ncbi:MAG TPA: SRPBCC family protein [Candidatus Udaeobacter sp.]|nr:SRPBCC family protein [Candidatus Udaeobacter sp.]